ncbi:MAG: GldG family protein [Myxococcota bacterium]
MATGDKERAQGAASPTTASARRRALGKTNLWLAGLLVVAIGGMVNYLAYRHYERWDWTEAQQFSLSDRTKKVLAELSQPVEIHLFLSQFERSFQDVRELLQRYRAESNRIQVHYVDPDQRPAEYSALLRKFGVRAAQLETGEVMADVAAVVSSGDEHWRIKRNDLVSLDFDPAGDPNEAKVDVKTEQAITGGILQVVQGEATKVCTTEGHGEWSAEGSGERSLWALEEELRRSNVEMETISTRGRERVPKECDAVLVIGPTRAFGEDEAGLLEDYVRSGGGVMLTLDPVFEHERVQASGLESMARDFGIRIDPAVVLELDPSRLLSPSPMEAFVVTDYGDHETTQPFAGAPTVVHVARSVRAIEGEGATDLLRASAQAFGETDVAAIGPDQDLEAGPDDIAGPLALAAAYEAEESSEEGRRGRLLVVGDSDLLQSDFLTQAQFVNADLVSAWVGWLTERKALISIAPRKIEAAPMLMTEEDLTALMFRVLVLIPAAVLLLGFAVWWSRRS